MIIPEMCEFIFKRLNLKSLKKKNRDLLKTVENQLDKKKLIIEYLEFCYFEFDNFCKQKRIIRYRTIK